MNRSPLVLAVMFCCLPGHGGARAEGAPKTKASPPPAAGASQPAAAKARTRGPGRVAFVDSATGRLVKPSASQSAALAQGIEFLEGLNFSHEGLTEVSLPEGGYKLDLQGRFRMALVATVGPDGKLRMGHPVSATPVRAKAATAAKASKEGDK